MGAPSSPNRSRPSGTDCSSRSFSRPSDARASSSTASRRRSSASSRRPKARREPVAGGDGGFADRRRRAGACDGDHKMGAVRFRRRQAQGFKYSRWDGTQTGFDLDADALLEEMSDHLLYHGDLNAALRRLMQQGFRDRNDEELMGLRDMLERLRQRRREELERRDLGGVYDDIAEKLREVTEKERAGIDRRGDVTPRSGHRPRQENVEEIPHQRP